VRSQTYSFSANTEVERSPSEGGSRGERSRRNEEWQSQEDGGCREAGGKSQYRGWNFDPPTQTGNESRWGKNEIDES